jgi:hypothetical protein
MSEVNEKGVSGLNGSGFARSGINHEWTRIHTKLRKVGEKEAAMLKQEPP